MHTAAAIANGRQRRRVGHPPEAMQQYRPNPSGPEPPWPGHIAPPGRFARQRSGATPLTAAASDRAIFWATAKSETSVVAPLAAANRTTALSYRKSSTQAAASAS